MIKDKNNIPTLLILKNILETVKNNSSRFVSIRYSHTFYNEVLKEIQNLSCHYTIINFTEIINNEINTDPVNSNKIPRFVSYIVQYLTELHPIIAFVDMLANIALDKFGYYLKKSDYQHLKKVFKIKKKSGKYQKLKNIIIANNLQNLKEENIQYIQFLGYLSKNGYLPNTAVIVFCDKIFDVGLRFPDADDYELNFTSNDFKKYTGENLENENLLEIIESLGLEYIDTLQEILKSEIKMQLDLTKQVIKRLIENAGYDSNSEELNKFLLICSYLFDEFEITDIEQLNKRIITNYERMFPVSVNAKILKNSQTIIYSFSEKKFKEYFLNVPSINICPEDAIEILNYLQKQYPDRYVDLALVSQFMPLKKSEIISYFMIAYYHRKQQELRYSNIIKGYLYDNPIGKLILDLDDCRGNIRNCVVEDLSYSVNKGIELLKSDSGLYPEAKLCALNYISDVAYEIITEQIKLQEIFEMYMKLFQNLNIYSVPNERYVDYVLDAVIFSTAIENYTVQKRTNKLVFWLEKRTFSNIDNKIKFYRLGNLLYVLNVDKALDFTHIAFDISENNLILHEETRLNYSVSLIGAGKYESAYNILITNKVCAPDYKNALQNNIIIAGFFANKFTNQMVLEKFDELRKNANAILTSDCCIISNNYVSALIINNCLEQEKLIEEICEQVKKSQDVYHIFFSNNNLLVLYYLKKEFKKFKKIFEQFQVPYLMRKYDSLIRKKADFLKENFFTNYCYRELDEKFKQLNSSEQYASELYSQPVIWGLMERWFK